MGNKANIMFKKMLFLEREFLDFLSDLPSLRVVDKAREVRCEDGHIADLVLTLEVRGELHEVWVEVKAGAIYPQRALEAVARIDNGKRQTMLVASSLSFESRELLRGRDIGYWDTSGSISLELPNALYLIDKEPIPQPREKREPRKVFKGKTTQVIHSLLLQPERDWKVTELAEESKVSAYTSQKVLEYLEKMAWVTRSGKGPQTVRRVQEPGKLLDAWAIDYEGDLLYELGLHQYATSLEEQISSLRGLMERAGQPWAVSLEHGANFYAPILTRLPSSISVWVSHNDWESLGQNSGYRIVDRGANVRLMIAKEKCPFLGVEQFKGLNVASPIQLYLDLLGWPKRGREQAEHLRKERLRF